MTNKPEVSYVICEPDTSVSATLYQGRGTKSNATTLTLNAKRRQKWWMQAVEQICSDIDRKTNGDPNKVVIMDIKQLAAKLEGIPLAQVRPHHERNAKSCLKELALDINQMRLPGVRQVQCTRMTKDGMVACLRKGLPKSMAEARLYTTEYKKISGLVLSTSGNGCLFAADLEGSKKRIGGIYTKLMERGAAVFNMLDEKGQEYLSSVAPEIELQALKQFGKASVAGVLEGKVA